MKLATPGDPVPADVRAALHGDFGAIAGVAVHGVNILARSPGKLRFSVFVNGWSPSLHAVDINYLADVPVTDGGFALATARRQFSWAVREQRRRAQRALSMGRALPLPADRDPVTGMEGPHLSHLHMDRALPPLAALDGDDLSGTIVDAVKDLHANPDDSNGGHRLADEMTSVSEVDGHMVVGRLVPIDTVPGKPCTFDGETLLIGGGADIPETVVALLPGRRVSDVMEVHPTLDVRTIVEAGWDDHGGIALKLERDLAPLMEILGRP